MAVSKRLRFEVLKRDGHACRYCGRSAPDVRITVDHVVPQALGGDDTATNLVAACDDCNSGKSSVAPDAPLVAAVSDEALRWGRAIRESAQRLLADREARNATYRQFDEAWSRWKVGTGESAETPPRPDDWKVAVDRFLAAGLPLEVLIDCIDIAMAAKKVRLDNVFRYMCGVAWTKVTDLQEGAKAALGLRPADAAPTRTDRRGLAEEIVYGVVGVDPDSDEYRALEVETKKALEEDERTVASDEFINEVAVHLVSKYVNEHWDVSRAIDNLMAWFIPADRDTLCKEGLEATRAWYPDGDAPWGYVTAQVLDAVVHKLDADYLQALPEAERNEWLACSASIKGVDADQEVIARSASFYARYHKAEGVKRHGSCWHPGEHGAMCPERATHRLWVVGCEKCARGECDGHPIICDRHLQATLDGLVTDGRGQLLEVTRVEELEQNVTEVSA